MLPVRANFLEELELLIEFGDGAAVAPELGPELREELVSVAFEVYTVARDDAVDDVQPVVEILEDCEKRLGFNDELLDLLFHCAGVP